MSRIWHHSPRIEQLNEMMGDKTIMSLLGIRITEIGEDYLRGTMPADQRTHQVYGVVHGGANVVLTETLGSMACALTIDINKYQCYGQHVDATHLRSVSTGLVTGTARPVHLGRRSQVWEIKLEDDEGVTTCVSRLIMAVVPTRKN